MGCLIDMAWVCCRRSYGWCSVSHLCDTCCLSWGQSHLWLLQPNTLLDWKEYVICWSARCCHLQRPVLLSNHPSWLPWLFLRILKPPEQCCLNCPFCVGEPRFPSQSQQRPLVRPARSRFGAWGAYRACPATPVSNNLKQQHRRARRKWLEAGTRQSGCSPAELGFRLTVSRLELRLPMWLNVDIDWNLCSEWDEGLGAGHGGVFVWSSRRGWAYSGQHKSRSRLKDYIYI